MPHRVFIAINLPGDIKKKLADYKIKWRELPCRWTKKDNLHITLSFLGYLSDEEVLSVCKTAVEVAARHPSFCITLTKIIFGPPKKFPPRMVWVEGEKNEDLQKFQEDLKNSLSDSSIQNQKQEGLSYVPHITLARIKTWDLKKIEPEEKPDINEEINLAFSVDSIEIMESQLKRGGPEYSILESCQLKN